MAVWWRGDVCCGVCVCGVGGIRTGNGHNITFLGKSEHMRYINFGKFYIEETKKILKIFQTRFSSLKRKRKMAFYGRGKLSKIVEDRFFKRSLACSGRF